MLAHLRGAVRLPEAQFYKLGVRFTMNGSLPLPEDIDVQAVKKLQDSGEKFVLIDVREPDEYATAHIEGSLHVPMRTVPSRLADLEAYRGERIVVHCHHGGRSARVAAWLREQGFERVQNMAGGIDAWSLQVDPSVPRYS